jgi:hypothetical protein
MGAREPQIPSLPEPTRADTLRVGALHAGAWRILVCERVRRLAFAGGVQCLVLLLGLEAHDAGFLLGPGTLWALGTRRAIFPGKPCLPGHAILRIVFVSHEILSLPMGQVTICRSQSTWKGALSKPVAARACQLGSSAMGPMRVIP